MQEDLKIAKEYLMQAYRLSKQIDYDLQELMRLEELAVSIQAVNYSERVQSSNSKDIIDCIEKIDSARKSINDKIIQYSLRVDCIKGTIGKIENRGIYDVLWERYILFKKWEDITYVKQLIANIDELKITLFVLNYLDDKEKENELY